MDSMKMIGAVLIVGGIAALVVPNISFTEEKKVLDLGPIEVTADEKHTISIPTVAGVIAIIAGLGVVVMGARKA